MLTDNIQFAMNDNKCNKKKKILFESVFFSW